MKDSAISMAPQRIGVLGAGAWGTALAQVAIAAGRQATIWAFEPDVARAIARDHENALYLPGISLHPTLTATTDLSVMAGQDAVLAVVPAQHMRATLTRLAPLLAEGAPLVLCAKGVEQRSLALMTDVAAEAAPRARLAVLSGPGFAKDVARGLPTATTIACADEALGRLLVASLGGAMFRPYWTDDLVGAEIGGAIKNVIAIACGIAEGRKLGDGARAALITRGFAEMSRLGRAMGARQDTLNGLSGLGDLVLTCSSLTSRNMSLGAALSAGADAASVLSERRSVAEGAASAPAVVALAARHSVEMPICAAIEALLAGRVSVDAAIGALLARPFRAEGE
jgi:glycerol-3-phosphate dehydrogenase (NAD(P)+)